MLRRQVPGRPIKIAVTEWNTTGGDWGPRRAMLWTLDNALACARYHNLLHRNADIVEIANRSNLTNSFCSGIIQTDKHRLYKTPTYYAQQLYATLAGNRPLRIEGLLPESPLDLSATMSADGKETTLFAVNDSLGPIERTIDTSAFRGQGEEMDAGRHQEKPANLMLPTVLQNRSEWFRSETRFPTPVTSCNISSRRCP